MARNRIFLDREQQRRDRECEAFALARLREQNRRMGRRHVPYPVFLSEARRDAYLDRLIGNAYQVRAKTLPGPGPNGDQYTVEDIDRRVGR